MHRQLAELIDKVDKVEDISSGNTFLAMVQQAFDAKNVAYLCLNLPHPTHDDYYLQHTYSSAWEQCYVSENLINTDPVVKQALTSITPTDWSQLKNLSKSEKRFFATAHEHGVGQQGLSFTVRGGFSETGIFSVNTDHSKTDWLPYKNQHISDLHLVSLYFHEKILRSQEAFRQTKNDILSVRELECLKWCTAGKSYWETSVILGISERTVNFHMTTVRQKLNAMTNAQAVAKAIVQGITSLS